MHAYFSRSQFKLPLYCLSDMDIMLKVKDSIVWRYFCLFHGKVILNHSILCPNQLYFLIYKYYHYHLIARKYIKT